MLEARKERASVWSIVPSLIWYNLSSNRGPTCAAHGEQSSAAAASQVNETPACMQLRSSSSGPPARIASLRRARASFSCTLLAPLGFSYTWWRNEMKSDWFANVTMRLLR